MESDPPQVGVSEPAEMAGDVSEIVTENHGHVEPVDSEGALQVETVASHTEDLTFEIVGEPTNVDNQMFDEVNRDNGQLPMVEITNGSVEETLLPEQQENSHNTPEGSAPAEVRIQQEATPEDGDDSEQGNTQSENNEQEDLQDPSGISYQATADIEEKTTEDDPTVSDHVKSTDEISISGKDEMEIPQETTDVSFATDEQDNEHLDQPILIEPDELTSESAQNVDFIEKVQNLMEMDKNEPEGDLDDLDEKVTALESHDDSLVQTPETDSSIKVEDIAAEENMNQTIEQQPIEEIPSSEAIDQIVVSSDPDKDSQELEPVEEVMDGSQEETPIPKSIDIVETTGIDVSDANLSPSNNGDYSLTDPVAHIARSPSPNEETMKSEQLRDPLHEEETPSLFEAVLNQTEVVKEECTSSGLVESPSVQNPVIVEQMDSGADQVASAVTGPQLHDVPSTVKMTDDYGSLHSEGDDFSHFSNVPSLPPIEDLVQPSLDPPICAPPVPVEEVIEEINAESDFTEESPISDEVENKIIADMDVVNGFNRGFDNQSDKENADLSTGKGHQPRSVEKRKSDGQWSADEIKQRSRTLEPHGRSSVDWLMSTRRRAATLGRNGSRRRPKLQPKPAPNDDHLFPDSVTPSKVDRGLSTRSLSDGLPEGTYDVPYIDDDAFLPRRLRTDQNEDAVQQDGDADVSEHSSDVADWYWQPESMANRTALDPLHMADTNECLPTPKLQPVTRSQPGPDSRDKLIENGNRGTGKRKRNCFRLCGCMSRQGRT